MEGIFCKDLIILMMLEEIKENENKINLLEQKCKHLEKQEINLNKVIKNYKEQLDNINNLTKDKKRKVR